MPAPQALSSAKAAPERRRNNALRQQAQAWFDAVQQHITQLEGAESVAALFKDWTKPEDIMRAYPALIPLFLDMVWRARKTAPFADLMRNANGDVVESTTEVLALSQKNFDQMIISHLMGAMRLTCEHRQHEWIAVERERRRNPLSKMPVIGPALRGLGFMAPLKTEVLLAQYPQRHLYEALKPSLVRREQFALVEPLATLSTRTVTQLGPVVSVLNSAAVIRTLVGLDKAALKTAIEISEAYVQATRAASPATPPSAPPPPTPPAPSGAPAAETGDLTAARGEALSEMLVPGTHFVRMAADYRQLALDAITKFAPVMKSDIWVLFGDKNVLENAEVLRRVAECPPGVAANLLVLTTHINERISNTLADITDARIATFMMQVLRESTTPEKFLAWISDEVFVGVWKQLASNLVRDAKARPSDGPLGVHHQTAIRSLCEGATKMFLADDPAKLAA